LFDIEFRHLLYFVAVAEEGSFTKAATRLHVSQPNLTKQMRQVEEALSAPLLVREAAGTRLAPAGLAFLPLARRLLQMREDAARTASDVHQGKQSAFRLGYSPFVSRGLLSEAVQVFRELRPDTAVEQINEGSATLAKMVNDGKLDAALVTLPISGNQLLKQRICSERYLICLREDDPHARSKNLSHQCVAAHLRVFVNRAQNPMLSMAIERKLAAANIQVRPTHFVSNPSDVQFQVQAGNGWGFVHESLKLEQGLVRRPIEGLPLRVRTAFISRKNEEHPLFPLLAFRLATTCENKPMELRIFGKEPLK
jgi:DNA-binding transcriptional LysR family regulator